MSSRDLSQLHRVLEWLAKDYVRTAYIAYSEGEVCVTLIPSVHSDLEEQFRGKASDFAGAVDIAESEGWQP